MTTTKKAAAKPAAKKTTPAKKAAAKRTPTKKAVEGGATSSTATPGKKAVAAVAPAAAAPRFDPAYPVADMKPHPKNPRRRAEADAEMVASIKEHGVLEPIVLGPDGTVVMGNRRRSGLVKAKCKTGPVLIRHDLDTSEKQLEVALVENLHREDLTAMEEAEAFAGLQDMGFTQAKIATRTGRPAATVRDRLKLLKLSKGTRDALHKGQLTIGDALAMTEFASDPVVTKRLDKAATSGGLHYAIEQARAARARKKSVDEAVAKAEKTGVPQVTWPKGVTSQWNLPAEGPTPLGQTFSGDLKDHPDCAGYLKAKDQWSSGVVYVCTNPDAHADQVSDEEKARVAERARLREEGAARAEAEDIAEKLRLSSVAELIDTSVGLHPRFRDVVRALLPGLVWSLYGEALKSYLTAMGVPETRHWTGNNTWSRKDEDVAAFTEHVRELGEGSDFLLTRALTAVVVGEVERLLGKEHAGPRLIVSRYFEFLEAIGHELTDVDQAYAAIASGADDDADAAAS